MSLIAELKRRNVFRVGAAYAIVGWLLVEVASVVLPTFKAPEWVMQAFTFLVILGFPLALIFAWAFELTPEGIKREKDIESAESITHQSGHRLDFAIIGLLAIAVVYFAVDKFVLQAEQEPAAGPIAHEESIRSLAVLPLENLSSDPEQAHFADATSNELIRELMTIHSLRVPAWTTVRRYKDSTKNAKEIASELGVAALVEGAVYREGNRIRITVQLIDGRYDRHIWAESFDRDFDQLLSLQREIAREVTDAIELQLTSQEQHHLAATARVDTDALDAYVKGIYFLGNEEFLSAIEQFEESVQHDPTFAPSYAMLAIAYLRAGSGWPVLPREEAFPNARNAARQALALDDSLALAHVVQGRLAIMEWKWDEADKSLRRGYELAPNDPQIMTAFADYLTLTGNNDEAITLLERAVAASPNELVLRQRLGVHLYIGRQYDRVFEEARRIREIDPSGGTDEQLSYFAHVALGNTEEAFRAFLSAIKPVDANSHWVAIGERALRTERADGAIRALIEDASEQASKHGNAVFDVGVSVIEFAYLAKMIGEVDSMFDWLERSYRLRESETPWISVDPVFDAYRSDPRFVDLLRRMNYPGLRP